MQHDLSKIQSHIQLAIQRLSEADWDPVQEEQGVCLTSKQYDNFPLRHYHVSMKVDGLNTAQMANLPWSVDTLADAQSYDSSISALDLLEIGTFETFDYKVRRQTNNLGMFVSAREVVFVTYLVKNLPEYPGHVFLVSYSVDHPNAEPNSSLVRSNLECSTYVIRPDGSQTLVDRFVNLNPNGNIPTFVINAQSAKVMENFKKWKSI